MNGGNKPYAVVFAGVPGSSKSIIAYHLSLAFSLAIFSTDNIRYEVKEDLLVSDINLKVAHDEFEKRREQRWKALLNRGKPFILDGSVDRRWAAIKHDLQEAGYDWLLIDLELSEEFLTRLYRATGRDKAVEQLAPYQKQHQSFVSEYAEDVHVRITDQTFLKRRLIAEEALAKFLKERQG